MRDLIILWERTLGGELPTDAQFAIWQATHTFEVIKRGILKTATKNQMMGGLMSQDHRLHRLIAERKQGMVQCGRWHGEPMEDPQEVLQPVVPIQLEAGSLNVMMTSPFPLSTFPDSQRALLLRWSRCS